MRRFILPIALLCASGCGGANPPVCSAYQATRATVCAACNLMPDRCPFGHGEPEAEVRVEVE